MSNVKHFVFVHGAAHGAWEWYKVATMLEQAGHKVTKVDMAASGINLAHLSSVSTFAEYSKPLLDVMAEIPSEEKVILVSQSYGGLSIALAMDTYPKKVAVGVFINAYMPDTTNPPSYVIDKNDELLPSDLMDIETKIESGKTVLIFGPKFLKTRLYQLTSHQDFTLARSLQRETSFFLEDLRQQKPFSAERYGSVPRVSIIAMEDLCIIPWFQDWMNNNYPANEVITMENTDHLAMLSNPDGVFKSLGEIAKKY